MHLDAADLRPIVSGSRRKVSFIVCCVDTLSGNVSFGVENRHATLPHAASPTCHWNRPSMTAIVTSLNPHLIIPSGLLAINDVTHSHTVNGTSDKSQTDMSDYLTLRIWYALTFDYLRGDLRIKLNLKVWCRRYWLNFKLVNRKQ